MFSWPFSATLSYKAYIDIGIYVITIRPSAPPPPPPPPPPKKKKQEKKEKRQKKPTVYRRNLLVWLLKSKWEHTLATHTISKSNSSEEGAKVKLAKTEVWSWEEGPRCCLLFSSNDRWGIRTSQWTERWGHGHQYHDYHLQYSRDSEILGTEHSRKKLWVTKDVLDLFDERRDLKRYEAEWKKNTRKQPRGFRSQWRKQRRTG